jgi:mannosylglycerate hydrolase
MKVPKSASPDEKARSSEKEEFIISTVLTLTGSSRRVDIKTTVNNTIKDHRFRALFATGINTNETYADTPFAVVRRQHRTYNTKEFWIEHPAMVAPMQQFVTVRDGKKSFTLIAKGLPEYELKLDQPGVLALTLLRCVGKLSGMDLTTRPGGAAGWWNETPEAQCQGAHTFEYAVLLGGAEGTDGWPSILKEVELFTVPPLVSKRKNNQEVLEKSFASIQPDSLSLSAFKMADETNGIILRLSNSVDRSSEGVIHFQSQVKAAYRAKMNEEITEPITLVDAHDLRLTVKPFEVVTLLVRIENG